MSFRRTAAAATDLDGARCGFQLVVEDDEGGDGVAVGVVEGLPDFGEAGAADVHGGGGEVEGVVWVGGGGGEIGVGWFCGEGREGQVRGERAEDDVAGGMAGGVVGGWVAEGGEEEADGAGHGVGL